MSTSFKVGILDSKRNIISSDNPLPTNGIVGGLPISEDNPLPITGVAEVFYIKKVDGASSTVTYIGQALPATLTSSSNWQIQKVTVNGNITSIEYADGNADFDNEWDERASYSYS